MGLLKIGEGCGNLESLDVSVCPHITSVSKIKIVEGCCRLKILNLSRKTYISDVTVINIIECCPLIEVLDLYDCPQISDISVVKIAEAKHLKDLDISSCGFITDVGIIKMIDGCYGTLEMLSMGNNKYITDCCAEKIAQKYLKLQIWNINFCSNITHISTNTVLCSTMGNVKY